MNLDQYLDALRGNRAFMSCVTHWETLPAQDARYMDLPLGLSAPIVEALKKLAPGKFFNDLCGFNKKNKLGLKAPSIEEVKKWCEE